MLGGVTAALLLLFRRDVADLAHLWWTSTTFGHCILILPVAGWLVWARRDGLAQLRPTAWWPGLLLVGAGGFAWLLGEAASAAVLRQLGLLGMVEGAIVALLGPNVARGLLFPLAYAWFSIPFGEALDPPLQRVTVALVLPLLSLVGVPASVDGVVIHAGRYWFEVAEACSATKYLLAMLAIGVLVARLCFARWRRRAAFLLACVVAPVLANGVRAFATMWSSQWWGVEAATGARHVVGGWLLFAGVTAALLAAAWRWFDRAPDAPAFDPAGLRRAVRNGGDPAFVGLAAVVLAAGFPAWGAVGNQPAALPARLHLPALSGWARAPFSARAAWAPNYPGASHRLIGRYKDVGGQTVDVAVAVFDRQREGAELIGFGAGVPGASWVQVERPAEMAGGQAERIRAAGPVERIVARWYAVGDVEISDPMEVKLATAVARLLGRSNRAIAVQLSAEVAPGRDPAAAIARLRAALGPLPRAAGLP